MKTIIDNANPERRPDAPVPKNFSDSVPAFSDSIKYCGDIFSGRPAPHPSSTFDAVIVVFNRLSRLRTWMFRKQFHLDKGSSGRDSTTTTEGVVHGKATVNQWEQSLGVEVGAGWGPFSASVSAALSRRGEESVSVSLSQEVSKTFGYSCNEGPAEVAIWQLREEFTLERWAVSYIVPDSDPAKVTEEMIQKTRDDIERALLNGRKPECIWAVVLPSITSYTDQHWLTSFPTMQDVKVVVNSDNLSEIS